MARARNIKPGFFQNEDLVELAFEVRLLFIGLWTMADKDGRLEDRPKKIKMGVFPADQVDVDAGIDALAGRNFIVRYEVDGCKFIQICNWHKHQTPHHTEKASVIPPLINGCITVTQQKQDGGNPPDSLIHRFSDSPIPDSEKTAAAATEPPSTGKPEKLPPPPSSAKARAETLATRLMDLESKRLGRAYRVSATDDRVAGWVSSGVSDPQFREAYEIALDRRNGGESGQPISPGFLDALIREVVSDDATPPPQIPVRSWHESAPGIEAKGAELGVSRHEGEAFPYFKARVFKAAGFVEGARA